jgi:cAMP-dependent protein kinase regulator
MGCGQSKAVDFSELDMARSEKQQELRSPMNPVVHLAQKAKPVMDNLLLADSTPKLSKQIQATTAVVMGSNSARGGGAHHLRNVFAPPLEDPGSFQAPVFFKSREEKQFIREALQSNFVFAALSERELRTIIDAFEIQDTKPNETIIVQGDVGDYFYVLRKGTVRFEVNGKVMGHAGEGKSFGELALLYTCPRAASVIAETKSTMYRVDQKTFRYIMQSQTLQTENDKKDLLKGVSFFHVLDPTDINKLVHTMIPRVFEAGECIVKKGEEGDTFYVIQEGKVRVTDITIGSTDFEDQTLGPGDYFGERALIHKEPRSANVIGKTKGIALSIDRETFEKVVGSIALLTLKAEDKRKLVSRTKNGALIFAQSWKISLFLFSVCHTNHSNDTPISADTELPGGTDCR